MSVARAAEPLRTHCNDGWLLYHGIRNILRCDEAEVVTEIAHYVISQHGILRFMAPLMERWHWTFIPAFFALLGWLRAFLTVRPPLASTGVIWIARLSNERRAIEPFISRTPELVWSELKYRHWPEENGLIAMMGLRRKRLGVRRIVSIARRLHRRHEFFKVLRVIELMAYYARYVHVFEKRNFKLAVMSSHSNPHAIAFNLVARKFCVPTVLITHGMPVRPVAKLSYDLALVHSEAAREVYKSEGCNIDLVHIYGRKQQSAPIPASLSDSVSVGVFLCKDVNEKRLLQLLNLLLAHPRVSKIVVRAHPKNLFVTLDSCVRSLGDRRIMRADGESVWTDLRVVDVVFGGNSSVLIDSIVAGRLAVYVSGLDYASDDLHRLVSRGLVQRFSEIGLSFDDLLEFYRRPAWQETLRLFADVDSDSETVAVRFCEELRKSTTSDSADKLRSPLM